MSNDVNSSQKAVWLFREGDKSLRDLLGGKGANLCEMTNIGLPVPPGFTITTATCIEYYNQGRKFPAGLMDEVKVALADVEKQIGKKFGDPKNPLLFSVRSGAKFSMPGMMDTVLNLGLNDETLHGLIEATGDARFAYDSYRRFLMMFSDITLKADYPGLSKEGFEHLLTEHKAKLGKEQDTDLTAEDWKALCETYKNFFREQTGGKEFPNDPMEQLRTAIEAVFRSWNNERAIVYRVKEKIDHNIGTAVNVQSMVFGNMGNDCGTGVAFTRNAANGDNHIYGEFLMNAQGEDVVAGVRTPMEIAELEKQNPAIYKEFVEIAHKLEDHYRDMQDIEFTIEKGKLFILQCRSGKRTGTAALKIAVDMVNENRISKDEAVLRVPPEGLEQALHPRLKGTAKAKRIAKGLNAGPGGAVGKAIFSSEKAAELGKGGKGEAVILVSQETTPDDIKGMLAAQGVLTSRGGRTSHAALVARQFGIPTVCGCSELKLDGHNASSFTAGGVTINEGDWITIDGTEGIVYQGALEVETAAMTSDFTTLMGWADSVRKLGVRANADTPEQAAEALALGATGIGLCRTEHMFLDEARLPIVRDMILAEDDEAARQKALDQLLPIQTEDFVGIFRAMKGNPVTIRLIDPPLHEFLPNQVELATEVAVLHAEGKNDQAKETLLRKVNDLHEQNPMLGLRGCRLSIVFPGIVEMQVGAIIGAAAQLIKEGVEVHPEIMIPLVGHINELTHVKEDLEKVAKSTQEKFGVQVPYSFGTMIEVPRAALTATEIAKEASFFSFGTNDLTQMTFGMSRDDAGSFLPVYIREEIYKEDPTVSIDQTGVGKLMQICVDDAKRARPDIKLGICGEHGGDPDSVKFCHKLGLNYVSCSPKRVPVARLAAAQAALDENASEAHK
ncbi:MAG: pyruvate, phosphate dikinase [Abitibacteriaceae bacterium]|nr:pyruvate, phosphate dikinase [Abditibacteriaceae bacterium]